MEGERPEKKPYDPKEAEPRIYALWEQSGFFNPDNLPRKNGKPFAVFLPLPNITGSLHMGHALNATLSDILVRMRRMQGYDAVWFPGTDHAGIAAQNVVEKELKKENTTRHKLGREAFLARVWEWKEKYGGIIMGQFKTMGASCDWSRSRFTLDDGYADAVRDAFIHYHEEGLLYRAYRTVNWCTRCATGISDLEVDYKEEEGVLYYLKYGPFTVATSRPETKFGDVALAVNPADERYKEYIGTEVEIATLDTAEEGRTVTVRLPVVGDEAADMAFGTGIIKVTPAHDMADFEIGERHKLPMLQVIDVRGKMANAGRFDGLKASEAREKAVAELRALGLVEREEKYVRNLAVCSRCATVIEPLPSRQWFLKMDRLAKATLGALEAGETNIIPENFAGPYKAWLLNIRDWCVSRQLWWGHRLPVWLCAKEENPKDGEYVVAKEKPVACPFCKGCDMAQTEDVCDTWFSSALWPFAGLSAGDRKRFYPSQVLVTARDIINLWVGRMVFSGLEFMGQAPFKDVFIHATVLTKDGKRMSKSLGTGIDPLTLVEKYGADATRFGIVWQAMGTQDIRFDEAAVAAGRKFANKIHNAARFVMGRVGAAPRTAIDMAKASPADIAVLGSADAAKKAVEKHLAAYEFGQALHVLYDFFWHDYCDVYLEEAKKAPSGETDAVLYALLIGSLKLLHPFIPFVTEAVWQELPHAEKSALTVAEWDNRP